MEKGASIQKNVKNIIDKPDVVFIEKKVVVFCDSEFWYGYNWEERKEDIKTQREFCIP